MGIVHCNIYSEALKRQTGFYAVVPAKVCLEKEPVRNKYAVLYLLHGATDDYTKWVRRVPIERMAGKYPLVVITPDADLSFYNNTAAGERYWDYLSEELPEIVKKMFDVSDQREHTFVMGLSMGGYGALKLGFSKPENYAAIAAFSSVAVLDTGYQDTLEALWNQGELFKYGEEFQKRFYKNAFGVAPQELEHTQNSICRMIERDLAEGYPIPAVYQSCGTEDFLYAANVELRDFMKEKQMDLRYEEWTGAHEWSFWEKSFGKALAWLQERGLLA